MQDATAAAAAGTGAGALTEQAAREAVREPVTLESALRTILTSLKTLWALFLAHLPLIIAGGVVLGLTFLVARFGQRAVRRALERAHVRPSLRDLFGQLFYIAAWIVGILVAALVMFPGFKVGQIVAALGLGSIAIGFAFKDIFENFFAGILILWRFPFEPGDFIECEGVRGEVRDVTIRMTEIRQTDGQLVVMPNATLFKNPVRVITAEPKRRVTIMVGVDYAADLDAARETIAGAVKGCGTVDGSRPIQVFAHDFGADAVNFEVAWWADPKPVDERRSRDEVVVAIRRALDAAGIEIPFPQRALSFREPVPLKGPLPLERPLPPSRNGGE